MSRVRVLLVFLLISGPSQIPGEGGEAEPSAEDSEEGDGDDPVVLSKHICLEARILEPDSFLMANCCGLHVEDDKISQDCARSFKIRGDQGNISATANLAKLAECIYIKKKFTKGKANLNFRRIKAAADKLNDPRERKFMMVMYKECSDEAKSELLKYESETTPGALVMGLRRPFYTLVFVCVTRYSAEKSCPYFRWKIGLNKKCLKYAAECKELLQKKQTINVTM